MLKRITMPYPEKCAIIYRNKFNEDRTEGAMI